MKKKFSIFNLKFFYYLRQILGNEYPDSRSEVKKKKVVVEDNLRWQDDGGPVVEVAHMTDQAAEDESPAKPADTTEDTSL